MSYLRDAIAPATRRAYATALAAFRQWRQQNGRLPDELLRTDDLVSWLSELADRGHLAATTLKTYAAALSTWYLETKHPDSREPNPASDPTVARVLKGIERHRARQQQARPLTPAAGPGQPLLFPTLLKLSFSALVARDRMFQAAAYLGVGGGLRPGELLGSSKEPERALRREQLSFFSDEAGTVAMHPQGGGAESGAVPRVLELTLRLTKTSQLGPVTKLISIPAVVDAVWRWICDTAERGPRAWLFQLASGEPCLSTFGLCKDLERRHAAAGLGPVHFTGKSWRRGGASTLSALGYEAGDIAALGWAADSKMWERYANDPQVRRQRAIVRGRLMQPAAAPPPGRLRGDLASAGRL